MGTQQFRPGVRTLIFKPESPSDMSPQMNIVPKFALLAAVGLILHSSANADVRIFEQPSVTYHTIQAAVDAAADGDTLLIADGDYQGFLLDGKGLTLLALHDLEAVVQGQVIVQNLPAASAVRFDGLKFQGKAPYYDLDWFESEIGVSLVNNQGAVHFYGCLIAGGGSSVDAWIDNSPLDPTWFPSGAHGLNVVDSISVALLDCEVHGGNGAGSDNDIDGWGGRGGIGIRSLNSVVALYDTLLRGGGGGNAGNVGGDGGDGCYISGIGMFASGCSFVGGNGGDPVDFLAPVGGDGGDGLWVSLNSNVRLVDNEYSGGIGGVELFPWGFAGAPGMPKYWEGGELTESPGTRRSLRLSNSIVGDGLSFAVQYEGQPGDIVYISRAARLKFVFSANPIGVRLVPFMRLLPIGGGVVVGSSGTATLNIPAHELPANGLRTQTAQALVRQASGGWAIGGAVLLTVMDDEGGLDCTGNGVNDIFDIILGSEQDCDGDFVPDSCPAVDDCNMNGIPDGIEIHCNGLPDLDGNHIPDECESA